MGGGDEVGMVFLGSFCLLFVGLGVVVFEIGGWMG